mmetsp:Transcript_6128/g.17567  ORF Transcript_6128/g.17567 Transcript_6128/m.17567 type:complete len:1319 (-) Transcript_6128:1259-5215(-)
MMVDNMEDISMGQSEWQGAGGPKSLPAFCKRRRTVSSGDPPVDRKGSGGDAAVAEQLIAERLAAVAQREAAVTAREAACAKREAALQARLAELGGEAALASQGFPSSVIGTGAPLTAGATDLEHAHGLGGAAEPPGAQAEGQQQLREQQVKQEQETSRSTAATAMHVLHNLPATPTSARPAEAHAGNQGTQHAEAKQLQTQRSEDDVVQSKQQPSQAERSSGGRSAGGRSAGRDGGQGHSACTTATGFSSFSAFRGSSFDVMSARSSCPPAERQMEDHPRFYSLPHLRGIAASGRNKTGAPDLNTAPAQPPASPFVAQLKRMSSRDLPPNQHPHQWHGVSSAGRGRSHSGAAQSGFSHGTGIVVSSGGGQFPHMAPTPPSVCTIALQQQQPQQSLQRQPSVLVSPRHPDTPTTGGVRIELSSTTPRLSVTGQAGGRSLGPGTSANLHIVCAPPPARASGPPPASVTVTIGTDEEGSPAAWSDGSPEAKRGPSTDGTSTDPSSQGGSATTRGGAGTTPAPSNGTCGRSSSRALSSTGAASSTRVGSTPDPPGEDSDGGDGVRELRAAAKKLPGDLPRPKPILKSVSMDSLGRAVPPDGASKLSKAFSRFSSMRDGRNPLATASVGGPASIVSSAATAAAAPGGVKGEPRGTPCGGATRDSSGAVLEPAHLSARSTPNLKQTPLLTGCPSSVIASHPVPMVVTSPQQQQQQLMLASVSAPAGVHFAPGLDRIITPAFLNSALGDAAGGAAVAGLPRLGSGDGGHLSVTSPPAAQSGFVAVSPARHADSAAAVWPVVAAEVNAAVAAEILRNGARVQQIPPARLSNAGSQRFNSTDLASVEDMSVDGLTTQLGSGAGENELIAAIPKAMLRTGGSLGSLKTLGSGGGSSTLSIRTAASAAAAAPPVTSPRPATTLGAFSNFSSFAPLPGALPGVPHPGALPRASSGSAGALSPPVMPYYTGVATSLAPLHGAAAALPTAAAAAVGGAGGFWPPTSTLASMALASIPSLPSAVAPLLTSSAPPSTRPREKATTSAQQAGALALHADDRRLSGEGRASQSEGQHAERPERGAARRKGRPHAAPAGDFAFGMPAATAARAGAGARSLKGSHPFGDRPTSPHVATPPLFAPSDSVAAAEQGAARRRAAAAAGGREGPPPPCGAVSHTKLLDCKSCDHILCLTKQMAADLLPLPPAATAAAGASSQVQVELVDPSGAPWPVTYRCVPGRYSYEFRAGWRALATAWGLGAGDSVTLTRAGPDRRRLQLQVNYRSGAAPPPPSRSSQSRASAAASAASDATVNTSPAASAALVPLLQAAAAVEGKLLG